MLKIYCSECGAPSEYNISKPKFCSNCGAPFNKTNISKEKKPVIDAIFIEDDDDNSDLEVNLEDIDLREEDIEYNCDKIRSFKMKDIIGTGSEHKRSKDKKIYKSHNSSDNDEILKQFSEEAGAVRPKNAKKE